MNIPIAVRIECAKGEIMNAMQRIQQQNALPPCIMDGILSSVLAEVRAEGKIEIVNDTNVLIKEYESELEKTKAEAKKVLDAESEVESES